MSCYSYLYPLFFNTIFFNSTCIYFLNTRRILWQVLFFYLFIPIYIVSIKTIIHWNNTNIIIFIYIWLLFYFSNCRSINKSIDMVWKILCTLFSQTDSTVDLSTCKALFLPTYAYLFLLCWWHEGKFINPKRILSCSPKYFIK